MILGIRVQVVCVVSSHYLRYGDVVENLGRGVIMVEFGNGERAKFMWSEVTQCKSGVSLDRLEIQ